MKKPIPLDELAPARKYQPVLPEQASDRDLQTYVLAEHRAGASRGALAKKYKLTVPTISALLDDIKPHVPRKVVRALGYDVRVRYYKKRKKTKNGG